ncbi:hypothetical protein CHELA20_40251 [Hyphomicrobiales bacterium]|nr:hypothetical protein CHELA20_40251 [Hyphomicrobiales bacterium]CAH1687889.1 hypothetical protein CHELA41_40106 [Hyphomicrobiales bacterium]
MRFNGADKGARAKGIAYLRMNHCDPSRNSCRNRHFHSDRFDGGEIRIGFDAVANGDFDSNDRRIYRNQGTLLERSVAE